MVAGISMGMMRRLPKTMRWRSRCLVSIMGMMHEHEHGEAWHDHSHEHSHDHGTRHAHACHCSHDACDCSATTITRMRIAELTALLHLASPALPIGAFSYSQGLEAAIEAQLITDADSARAWIASGLDECARAWRTAVPRASDHALA